jgi:hypothetical protein
VKELESLREAVTQKDSLLQKQIGLQEIDVERFTSIDRSKGEQIEKLTARANQLQQENAAIKDEMVRELASLRRAHEDELKQHEQESIAIVQQSLADQSEEMKKFGEFIK